MNSLLPLPDWMPWWSHLAILLAILFFGLMFLLMPFSVFGTKSRLESIEAHLDEIHGELRSLALRLPEVPYRESDEEIRVRPRNSFRPPAPPPRGERDRADRTEPRLY